MTEINLYARISKPFSRIERKPIQDYNWYSEHPDLNSFDFRVHYDFQSNRFADGLINFEYVDGNKFKIALGDKYFADDPNDWMTPIVRSCVKDCNDDSLIAKYVLEKEYEEEPAEGGGQIVCPWHYIKNARSQKYVAMDYYGKVFEKTVAEMNNSNDYYVLAEQIEVNTNNYW